MSQRKDYMDCVKRIWYLSPMRAAKVQASLRIRAVSPEPSLLAHTSSESRGTFRQKARSLALLNGWACAVKICHNGMLEDTNSLDGPNINQWKRCILPTNKLITVHAMKQKHNVNIEKYLNIVLGQNKPFCCIFSDFPCLELAFHQ